MKISSVKTEVKVRTLGAELRKAFGCRVHKIPLHAGMSCPNRDGTLGTEGCIYCGPLGSAACWSDPDKGISEQMLSGMAHARERFQASRFIAYFQSFTNTYAPVPRLRSLWDEALGLPDVVGLSMGTRPDCLSDEVLDLIGSYRQRVPYLCLEVGLQSAHDRTLKRIHRGHDFACFAAAVSRAQARGIPLCVHVILGLPGETIGEMMETIRIVLEMGIEGIKLHHLHVLKDSPLENAYRQGKVQLLEMSEYAGLVGRILTLISGRMVIHRFMGEVPEKLLVAPLWTRRKGEVLEAVSRALEEDPK